MIRHRGGITAAASAGVKVRAASYTTPTPACCAVLHRLQVCSRLRLWYKASMKLQFNLLMFLRYVSPPAVLTALYKARKRVYRNYGTRVQRQK